MSFQRRFEEFTFGKMTPFRVQNCGQDEYKDLQNIYAHRKGVYKLIYEKHKDALVKGNYNFISNGFADVLLGGSALALLAGIRICAQSTIGRVFCLVPTFVYLVKFRESEISQAQQLFLLENFKKFTDQEQKALLTGDARYFYESFGDLKKDKKTKMAKVL